MYCIDRLVYSIHLIYLKNELPFNPSCIFLYSTYFFPLFKRSNISSASFAFCLHSFIFFSSSYSLFFFFVFFSCKFFQYAICFLFIFIPPILFLFIVYHDSQISASL